MSNSETDAIEPFDLQELFETPKGEAVTDRLKEIEERADRATIGPWMRGYTLMTPQTKTWSAKAVADNDLIEGRRIFANFTEEDQGRGRKLIAECPTDWLDCEFIAHSREDVLWLIKELKKSRAKTPRGV